MSERDDNVATQERQIDGACLEPAEPVGLANRPKRASADKLGPSQLRLRCTPYTDRGSLNHHFRLRCNHSINCDRLAHRLSFRGELAEFLQLTSQNRLSLGILRDGDDKADGTAETFVPFLTKTDDWALRNALPGSPMVHVCRSNGHVIWDKCCSLDAVKQILQVPELNDRDALKFNVIVDTEERVIEGKRLLILHLSKPIRAYFGIPGAATELVAPEEQAVTAMDNAPAE